ncbi:sensor histidine kinase [Streptosporangium vulgare]|uniref:sensor histidine kinase n=1 Tax=Streptosporangium vulgare TaxID=46190 RepID=UPI0031E3FE40
MLAAGKEIGLSVTGPPVAVCSVDEPTMSRAISNLVDNAIRYAPAGSRVEIDVEVTGTEAAVTVTDHGPGVPDGEREHVFQRFWRGRRDVPGTGLGLPIARQIALAHGGDLTLSPFPARRRRLCLPAHPAPLTVSRTAPRAPRTGGRGRGPFPAGRPGTFRPDTSKVPCRTPRRRSRPGAVEIPSRAP